MNPSEQVRDLEEQRDALLKGWREVWEIVKTIGENDSRSVSSIALQIRGQIPHTYLDRRGRTRRIETGEET